VLASFRAIASAIARMAPERKNVISPRAFVFARSCTTAIARAENRMSTGAAARSSAMLRPTGDPERTNRATAAASRMHGSRRSTSPTCIGLVLLLPAAARPSTNSRRIPRRSRATSPQNATRIMVW